MNILQGLARAFCGHEDYEELKEKVEGLSKEIAGKDIKLSSQKVLIAGLTDGSRELNKIIRQRDEQLATQTSRIETLEEQLRPIAPPQIFGELNSSELRELLLEAFPNLNFNNVELADRRWKLTTVAEMNRALAKDDTDMMTWRKDWPDCDDFTRRLLGNLTVKGWWSILKGDIWVDWKENGKQYGHSVAITALYDNEVDLNKGIYLIEGQTDALELASEMFDDISVKLIKI